MVGHNSIGDHCVPLISCSDKGNGTLEEEFVGIIVITYSGLAILYCDEFIECSRYGVGDNLWIDNLGLNSSWARFEEDGIVILRSGGNSNQFISEHPISIH